MAKQPCLVCSADADVLDLGSTKTIACIRCGNFSIGDMAANEIEYWTGQQKTNLSGWIRENPKCKITSSNLKPLSELRNLTVVEKAEKLLDYLACKHPTPGEKINFFGKVLWESQAASRALDGTEHLFIIDDYLYKEKGFISYIEFQDADLGEQDYYYKISPAGWAHLDLKRQANPNSQIGFIAMWFDKSVDAAHLAIETGIRDSGYDPLRIDRKEHNNKIDDEIVAGIRRSKFLVADFTGHRGGVYFEAGLAMGLGLPVIWLCRKDDLEKTHFDTRQYNFIVWEPNESAILSKALQSRIEATIGRGPLNPNAVV